MALTIKQIGLEILIDWPKYNRYFPHYERIGSLAPNLGRATKVRPNDIDLILLKTKTGFFDTSAVDSPAIETSKEGPELCGNKRKNQPSH